MADGEPRCTVPEMVGYIAEQVRETMKKLRETMKPVEDKHVKKKLMGVNQELKDLEQTLGRLKSALTWSEHIGVPAVRTNEGMQKLREAVSGCWDTCKDVAVLVSTASSDDEDSLEELLEWSDNMCIRGYRVTLAGITKVVMETADASDSEPDQDHEEAPSECDDGGEDTTNEPSATLMEALAVSVRQLCLNCVSIPKPTLEVPLTPIQEDDDEFESPSAVSPLSYTPPLGLNIQGLFDPLNTPPGLPGEDYYFNGDLVSPLSPVSSLFNSPTSTIFRTSSKSSHETVSADEGPSTPEWDEGKIPLSSEVPIKFPNPDSENKQLDDFHCPLSLWTDKAYFFFPTVDHYTTPYERPPTPPNESKTFEGRLVNSQYVLTRSTTSQIRSAKRRYKVEFFSNGTSQSSIYSRNSSSMYGRSSVANTVLQSSDQWTFRLHNHTAAYARQSVSFLPAPRSSLPSFSTPSEAITLSPLGRKELDFHGYAFARFTYHERVYICTVGFVDHAKLFTKITEYRHSIGAAKESTNSSASNNINPDDPDADRKYIKTVVSFSYVDVKEGKNYRNKVWVKKCMRENLETLLLLIQAHFGYVALKYVAENEGKEPVPIVGRRRVEGNDSTQSVGDGSSAREKETVAIEMPMLVLSEEDEEGPVVLSPTLNQGPGGFVSSTTYC
ncbi:hypothetical protein BJ508DRAFT_588 [Ascobolus immersus RN42]|uniref:Uncharacterized protein n=1 Tax=Ascobolus immersus RN42 TaxID=1160509 RepID=A0A3N4IUQ1_ASCIM|nr:hypothetical protein BJ508DRAFT_588 [Ascobolus immersus RN42]